MGRTKELIDWQEYYYIRSLEITFEELEYEGQQNKVGQDKDTV